MYVAGTDSTGTFVGVCLYLLAKYPEYQEKLRKEINSTFKNSKEIEHS
jgi:cytochrome P450